VPFHERADLIRVCGVPSVTALFKTEPDRVQRLFFVSQIQQTITKPWRDHLAGLRRPFREVESEELKKISGTAMHGGVVAFATAPEIPTISDEDVARLAAEKRPLIVLDGVGNPQNLGAIARTAAFFGCDNLVLSDSPSQAGISDASYRVAKGGIDGVTIWRAKGFQDWLSRLKGHYHVVGTVAAAGKPWIDRSAIDRPIALVLGNEEHGLTPEIQAACDTLVTLPGSGAVQSLNVSATAAILIHGLLSPAPAGNPPA
jgi:TrmH RNA methyltransferase